MSTPLVSVVLPTFNRRRYLREALDSVLAQTYQNLDILVVDNASEDGTAEEVASIGDPRIRYLRHDQNIGQFRNFKSAFQNATGTYVGVLGDDDLLAPNFVERLLAPMERDPDLVLAFCDHDIIDGAGTRLDDVTEQVTKRWRRHVLAPGTHRPFGHIALVDRAICTTSAALVRRDAIDWDAMPEDIELGFDLYLAYECARTERGCWYDPERLTHYRYHASSASNSIARPAVKLRNLRDAMMYWDRFARDPAVASDASYFRMKRGYNALLLVLNIWRSGDPKAAFAEFGRFVRRGWIEPSMFVWHLIYAARLNRLAA